jgi:ribosomal-protein-alanine N-acetyltransferase
VFSFLHPRGAGERVAPILGERVLLRPPRHADWRAWVEVRSASRAFLAPWEPSWPPDALTRKAFRRRVRQQALERRDQTGYGFLIFERTSGGLLGGITVSDVQRGVAQSCSLGYWIGAGAARRGYMTEALLLVLRFVFAELGLHRATAACLPGNRASQGLLRKVGFREEGYAREYLRIDGRWQDHVLFGMVASDLAPAAHLERAPRAAE